MLWKYAHVAPKTTDFLYKHFIAYFTGHVFVINKRWVLTQTDKSQKAIASKERCVRSKVQFRSLICTLTLVYRSVVVVGERCRVNSTNILSLYGEQSIRTIEID